MKENNKNINKHRWSVRVNGGTDDKSAIKDKRSQSKIPTDVPIPDASYRVPIPVRFPARFSFYYIKLTRRHISIPGLVNMQILKIIPLFETAS